MLVTYFRCGAGKAMVGRTPPYWGRLWGRLPGRALFILRCAPPAHAHSSRRSWVSAARDVPRLPLHMSRVIQSCAMRRSTILLLCAAAAVAAIAFVYCQSGVVYSQAPGARLTDDGVISFCVRFGVFDAAPRAWDGALTVANGELLNVRNWHPRPGDSVSGSSWKLATRRAPNFARRPW